MEDQHCCEFGRVSWRVRRLLRRPTISNANSGQNLTTSSNAAEYVPDRGIFQPAALQLDNSSLPKRGTWRTRDRRRNHEGRGEKDPRDEGRARRSFVISQDEFTQRFIRYVPRFYLG